MPPKLIGISGTNGSGKDTVGGILAAEHNYHFISVTDILRAELKSRGMSYERKNMRALSSEWRKKYGLGVLVDKAMEIYASESNKYYGLVMASLRNPGEADTIHSLGGVLIWVDANPKIRYARVSGKSRGEHRSVNDNKTYEEFLHDEEAEMRRPKNGDETSLAMIEVKDKSDLFLSNDTNDLDVLRATLDQLLGFTA